MAKKKYDRGMNNFKIEQLEPRQMFSADVRATFFGGLNYSGYTLIGAGYLNNGIFNDLGRTTYWFYPGEISATEGFTNWSSNTTTSLNSTYHTPKLAGESVRCVKIE